MSGSIKKFSASALVALKEALAVIYWTKKDLKSFLNYTIKNKAILSTIDWENNYKIESVSQLIDRMVNRPDIYQEDLIALFDEVSNFSDFSHLKKWEDPDQKIKNAKEKVAALRQHAKDHFDLAEERRTATERKKSAQHKQTETIAYQNKIEALKSKLSEIAINRDHRQRGYDFEKFLNELFILFDLDPKSSFKIIGEQIDGAFTFDNNDYLLEAKWQDKPVDAGDLYKFAGKLSGKLKNTLGLYVSINGFSSESTKVEGQGIKAMILLDGNDLIAVLEGRIALPDLLYRKRRHASETGDIYLTIDKILI